MRSYENQICMLHCKHASKHIIFILFFHPQFLINLGKFRMLDNHDDDAVVVSFIFCIADFFLSSFPFFFCN